jgi:hypothetical protein
MSDYTVDDSMSKIVYDLSDREIYNDIRGEIGILKTETILDTDVTYTWRFWQRSGSLPAPGYTMFRYFTAFLQDPITWELINVSAQDSNSEPYFDYQATLIDTNDDKTKGVEIKNTGTSSGIISYKVRYKFLSAEAVSHEETSWDTLTVRAFDETSILKYGRRVMPLRWPQGATTEQMQMVADAALARYKDPYHVLHVTLRGDTAAKATQIFTREISDVITVTCANLGMTGVDHFIDAISIDDTALKSPVATWQLISERATETTSYFMIDTDSIDGLKLIAGSVGWFIIDTDRLDGNKLIG